MKQTDKKKAKQIGESVVYTIIALISVVLALLLFLSSCTPQRRLNRLLKRHPYLLQEQQTIIVHDTVTVTIPGTKVDTLFSVKQLRDTVFFTREQLHVKTWIKNDTVYIQAECDTVTKTVIREIPVKTNKFIYRKPRDGLILWLIVIAALIGIAVIAISTFKNVKY